MRRTAVLLFALAAALPAARAEDASLPHLKRQGAATQLVVDGKPFILLAGELHNSSATGPAYMESLWPRLKALHLNAVIGTASWELVEPEEGKFDFALVDGLIKQARASGIRLVLIWFGSWKNGVSSYCPGWVLRDTKRFPRCLGSSNRNTKDILTPLSEENQKADARAFAALLRHLREFDGRDHTVVLVQVENEVGIKPEPRDLSPLGDEKYNGPVPAELTAYLQKNKDALLPELRGHWEKAGLKTSGSWAEVFGKGFPSEEIFMAWHYARYINAVAKAGKAEYPLPMYANAWLRSPDWKPGHYPVGGPLAHVMDVWKAAAPEIALLAPDIYLADFKGVCAEYTQQGNPLFIPEARTDPDAAARAFWAIAEHGAIGFAPFGIDHVDPEKHPLGEAYAVLDPLLPSIAAAQGTGRLRGLYQQDASQEAPEKPVDLDGWRANVRFMKRRPSKDAAYGLILQTGAEEFLVAGWGLEVNFSATAPGPRRGTGILSVEMGRLEKGAWVTEMRLNGDETGANYVAKLPPNTDNVFLDPLKPRILRVRLYRYD